MGQNSALIRRWFDEVWNQGREETVDAMCAKDVIGHGQAQHGADIHGPEHFKQFLRSFLSGFSDIHVEIHDTIEQDDKVIARLTPAEPGSQLTVGELNAFLHNLPSLGDDADDFAHDVRAIRAEFPAEANPWD